MQKTIPQLLAVVRALSDQRFLSYERFREKVTFQKREFAFSCFFCAFLWSRILLKLLLGVFVIILNILVKTRALLSRRFPSGEFFCLFLRFEKDEFQDRVGSNCCRRHVKGKEATSNTKIVANMPTAAAAAAAAATSTFTATVITANIIDQTFTIFFGRREPPLLVQNLNLLSQKLWFLWLRAVLGLFLGLWGRHMGLSKLPYARVASTLRLLFL